MNVLLVVYDPLNLGAGDVALQNRLQNILGHTVTIIADTATVPNLSSTSLVVIAPSSDRNAIGSRYDNVTACGIIAMLAEPHSGFSASANSALGDDRTNYSVIAPGDPLAGAYSGTVTFYTSSPNGSYAYFNTSSLGSGVVAVVSPSADGERTIIARAGQGVRLATGYAPTRRVYYGMTDLMPAYLVTAGWDFFDACVVWASVTPGVIPVAAAGSDQVVDEATIVQLNGSASSDSDGSVVSYEWRVISSTGPSVTLSNTAIANPTFTAPNEDCLIICGLIVTDNEGIPSPEDSVSINVVTHMHTKIAIGGSWVNKPVYTAKSGSWY